jgi:hypothetical protein
MRKKRLQCTVSTVLTPQEFRELKRYVRAKDKSTSAVVRDLLVPLIRERVTAQAHDVTAR